SVIGGVRLKLKRSATIECTDKTPAHRQAIRFTRQSALIKRKIFARIQFHRYPDVRRPGRHVFNHHIAIEPCHRHWRHIGSNGVTGDETRGQRRDHAASDAGRIRQKFGVKSTLGIERLVRLGHCVVEARASAPEFRSGRILMLRNEICPWSPCKAICPVSALANSGILENLLFATRALKSSLPSTYSKYFTPLIQCSHFSGLTTRRT